MFGGLTERLLNDDMSAFFSFPWENYFKIFGPTKIPSDFDGANKTAQDEQKKIV